MADHEKFCRCCLDVNSPLKRLSQCRVTKYDLSYSTILLDICAIDFDKDNLPDWICERCSIKLKNAYAFRFLCHQTLKKILGDLEKQNNFQKLEDECIDNESDSAISVKVEIENKNYDKVTNPSGIQNENIVKFGEIKELNNTFKEKLEENVNLKLKPRKVKIENVKHANLERKHGKLRLCTYCGKKCKTQKCLMEHINAVHFGIKYYCELCKHYYKSESVHNYVKHGKGSWVCKVCELNFEDKIAYEHHLIDQHNMSKIICECGEKFLLEKDYKKHRISVHEIRCFECDYCHKNFGRKNTLRFHILRHNVSEKSSLKRVGSQLIDGALPVVKPKSRRCTICDKLCKSNRFLLEHMKIVHAGIMFFCEICKKSYMSEIRHNLKWHSLDHYKCNICPQTFSQKLHYLQHCSDEHNNMRYGCKQCNINFRLKPPYDQHMANVHNVKDFICQYCSKAFSSSWQVENHIRIHTRELKYKCDVCSRGFVCHRRLNSHKKRHLPGKSLPCSVCMKMFKTRDDLKAHEKTHDPSKKRHACKFCGKLFHRSDHRNNHQNNVHANNTFLADGVADYKRKRRKALKD